jgi:hypothetical protein
MHSKLWYLRTVIIATLILFLTSTLFSQSRRFNKYEDVSGYINITEVGGGMGIGTTEVEFSDHFAGFTIMNGYVIDHHFLTGLGLGAHVYGDGVLVPAYLDIRYTFNNRKFTPFLYGDAGLLLDPEDIMGSGMFLNPGVGVKRKISSKIALSVSGGLFVQHFNARSSFVNVKIGLYFTGNAGDPCIRK